MTTAKIALLHDDTITKQKLPEDLFQKLIERATLDVELTSKYIQPQNVQADRSSSNGITSRTGASEYIHGILQRESFKRIHATFL